ncbi:MAG TPA: DUF6072 family protein [Bradyrhizobium sp.]|nr:DUF6072 family protein [Bradyrhizobium sp.]
MEQNRVGGNAASLLGEIFLPGASQYMAGKVGAGLVHSLLAMSASALLIGSGAAPMIGALAVLGLKLNSYSSATTGRNLWDLGTEVVDTPGTMPGTPPTTGGPGAAGSQDDREASHPAELAADQENADAPANLVPPPSSDAARVQALGGQSGRLQVILAWDDHNDLDLHIVCPNGEEIAYNNKRAGGGELDVDATGAEDASAENIRFEAPAPGRYQILVVLYSARAASQSPFRVTIRRQGQQDQVIQGIARQQGERQLVHTVEFND